MRVSWGQQIESVKVGQTVKVKVKEFLHVYSAISGPLYRSKPFTLFALPGRPVQSNTNSASPGSILAMLQLRAKTKSLTCPPLSIARYSFIQLFLVNWSVNGENENTQSSKR